MHHLHSQYPPALAALPLCPGHLCHTGHEQTCPVCNQCASSKVLSVRNVHCRCKLLYNAPVQVVEAKNVPKMDYFTSTSPYVQVSTHKRGAKQVGTHCQ